MAGQAAAEEEEEAAAEEEKAEEEEAAAEADEAGPPRLHPEEASFILTDLRCPLDRHEEPGRLARCVEVVQRASEVVLALESPAVDLDERAGDACALGVALDLPEKGHQQQIAQGAAEPRRLDLGVERLGVVAADQDLEGRARLLVVEGAAFGARRVQTLARLGSVRLSRRSPHPSRVVRRQGVR